MTKLPPTATNPEQSSHSQPLKSTTFHSYLVFKKKLGPERISSTSIDTIILIVFLSGQAMDQFIKQDETGDLIETGMNVANHFLSAPIQGTNLLSKATIIPGVAPVLIGNPEQKNIQYPTASHQGSKSKGRSSGAKPIIVSSSDVGTGGTQIPEPLFAQTGQGGTVTTVYQDPTIQPTGSYRSVELAKIGKERMINRFVEKPRTSTPVTEFKRGAGSGCSRPDNPRGGHRREWSLSWVQGEVRVFEWCNPICSPITAAARFHSCKCGNCPAKCDQCERDYGPP